MKLLQCAVIGLLASLLTACLSPQVNDGQQNKQTINTIEQYKKIRAQSCDGLALGPKTACYLQQDYALTVDSCGTSGDSPAFLCSGVVLRGTASDINRPFYSWNPSPASQQSRGVSFSYLRADAKYKTLAYGYVTGFIFHPILYTPAGQDSNIEILCSFPMDGATDDRDNRGCGNAFLHPAGRPCYVQFVDTGAEWVDHYKKYGGETDFRDRCGFIVENNYSFVNTQNEFNTSISAMKLLGNVSFNQQNELRLATWEQNKQDIPIQAFFYLANSAPGLASAKKDQKDFYNFSQTHRIIPIIRLTLPSSQTADAKFEFIASDQLYIE